MVAINFQPELNPQNRWPSLEELDQAGRGHPIYLMERTGHISLVNSAAGNLTNPPLPAGILRGHENSTAFTQLWTCFPASHLPMPDRQPGGARYGVTNSSCVDDLEVVKSFSRSGSIYLFILLPIRKQDFMMSGFMYAPDRRWDPLWWMETFSAYRRFARPYWMIPQRRESSITATGTDVYCLAAQRAV
jgi:hypothetical protein